jgi:type I restriction enzyme, S subunit
MNWLQETVGSVCVPTSWRDPRQQPDSVFKYIDISGIDREKKEIRETRSILGSQAPSRARKEVATGDILVSTVRPNLNAVAMVPESLDGEVASTGFCVLRADGERILSRFLFYFVRSIDFINLLCSRVRGASYPAVTDADVREVPLSRPSLPEQRQIIEILDQADRVRELRHEADSKAERILPALFIRLFGHPAEQPLRWGSVQLGNSVEHLTSGARNWSEFTGRGSAFFLRTQDIVDGEVSSDLLLIEPPAGVEADRTRLIDGDVVVTITGVVGKAAVFEQRSHDAYVSQHVALVRLKRDVLLPHYFATYANFPVGPVPTLARLQYGQTKPGLGFRELKQAFIPKPPSELQVAFTRQVLALRGLRQKRQRSRDVLERLWGTLLQRAFTGDLTASWREAHMNELLQEMEHQAKALASLEASR